MLLAALSIKDINDTTLFEMIGDFKTEMTGIAMTDNKKLSFKRATHHAIMEAHCSNEAVLNYGTEKEVRIFNTNYFFYF